ncbi:hypothetical protein EBR25_14465 [bacterium]|nr:hypothetical protein [bacterium]
MPILVPKYGLAIYTSPKVLSTSLKSLAFFLENSRDFEPFRAGGKTWHVHSIMPTTEFERIKTKEYPHKIAFVREPIERFTSFFRNRVLRRHKQSLIGWRRAVARGLPPEPTFSEFVSNLSEYRQSIVEVAHHTEKQVVFLGYEASEFEKIYTPHSVNEFQDYLRGVSGMKARLPHQQKSGRSRKVEIKDADIKQLRDFYRVDFETYGAFF